MKNPFANELPYVPTTPVEKEICDRVVALSGEVILDLWTQADYPFYDGEDRQREIPADYVVRTGRLSNGLFCAGSFFNVQVTPDGLLISDEGGWR